MTNDTDSTALEAPRRFHFDWVLPALFRPRRVFEKLADYPGGAWLTPILLLMVTGLLYVALAGPVKQMVAQNTPPQLPPGFEYYSPDQQQQFLEAQSAQAGPMFVYVFPALTSVLGVWASWLILGGLLHLVLTLLGGRGSTRVAMNLVAWASLPFAVRDVVRAGYVVITQTLIMRAGISGFASTDGSLNIFLGAIFALVDIYLLWHIFALTLGIRVADKLSWGKALGAVIIALLIFLPLQALPGFIASWLGAQAG